MQFFSWASLTVLRETETGRSAIFYGGGNGTQRQGTRTPGGPSALQQLTGTVDPKSAAFRMSSRMFPSFLSLVYDR